MSYERARIKTKKQLATLEKNNKNWGIKKQLNTKMRREKQIKWLRIV